MESNFYQTVGMTWGYEIIIAGRLLYDTMAAVLVFSLFEVKPYEYRFIRIIAEFARFKVIVICFFVEAFWLADSKNNFSDVSWSL